MDLRTRENDTNSSIITSSVESRTDRTVTNVPQKLQTTIAVKDVELILNDKKDTILEECVGSSSTTDAKSIKLSIDKCMGCQHEVLCIVTSYKLDANYDRVLKICEFCYRTMIFGGVTGIDPSHFKWDKATCNNCGRKRYKGFNESRFCNCK